MQAVSNQASKRQFLDLHLMRACGASTRQHEENKNHTISLIMKLLASLIITLLGSTLTTNPALSWPQEIGSSAEALTTDSRGEIPSFPASIPGFIREPGLDFWNKPTNERGQVRTYGDSKWEGIHDFPNTQNGCDNGIFLIRWRATGGPVYSATGHSPTAIHHIAEKPSAFGYMHGSNCQQPLFKGINPNTINNVLYEVIFWKASV